MTDSWSRSAVARGGDGGGGGGGATRLGGPQCLL